MNTALNPKFQSSAINFVKCNLIPAIQASNDENFRPSDFNIREITSITEKKKWMNAFFKHYSGQKIAINPYMLGKISRFFVSSIKGKDIGFIRITNYTEHYKKFSNEEVWNASDAYVKGPYRGRLVLRSLLEFVIRNCNVKMVRLETSRHIKNCHYYTSLGFNFSRRVGDGYLSIAVKDEIKEAFIKLTD